MYDMLVINITPPVPDAEKAITDDVRNLHAQELINAAAYMFTLVPDGNPPRDLAGEILDVFARHRALLHNAEFPVGVLMQATMGHGWKEPSEGFERVTAADGSKTYTLCPLDPQFQTYVSDAVRRIAALRPDFLMLDDDTRLFSGRPAGGCHCPRHRELAKAVGQEKAQLDSMLDFARLVRAAVDAVDPEMPIYYCACDGDIPAAIGMTRILAGRGNPPVLRINNAYYWSDSLGGFPARVFDGAAQIAALPSDFLILAETDCCPQTRYAMSATLLGSLYLHSLINGAAGGKLWITQTSNEYYEEETGRAYRDYLCPRVGLFKAVADMKPEWIGVKEVLPSQVGFGTAHAARPSWGGDLLSLYGLPFFFSTDPTPDGRRVALSAKRIAVFCDEELDTLLDNPLLLDHAAEKALLDRGLSEKLASADVVRLGETMVPFTTWINRGLLRHVKKLELAGKLGVPYYSGTAPMTFRAFRNDGVFTTLFMNLGLDVESVLPLAHLPSGLTRAERLAPDGSWHTIPFDGNTLRTDIPPAETVFVRFF